jgi:hypothetical protein
LSRSVAHIADALIIVAGAVWLLQGLINRWMPGKTIPAAEIGAKMPAEPR